MKELFDSITTWQNSVFTKATPLSCVNHLQEEVTELKAEIEAGKHSPDEIADCFLLLIGVCNKSGMKYEDVINAINGKMEVNLKRKWGAVNSLGYVKHIISLFLLLTLMVSCSYKPIHGEKIDGNQMQQKLNQMDSSGRSTLFFYEIKRKP